MSVRICKHCCGVIKLPAEWPNWIGPICFGCCNPFEFLPPAAPTLGELAKWEKIIADLESRPPRLKPGDVTKKIEEMKRECEAEIRELRNKLFEELKKNPSKLEPPQSTTPQGWQCPVCKTVHAPFVRSCPQSHPK